MFYVTNLIISFAVLLNTSFKCISNCFFFSPPFFSLLLRPQPLT